MEIHFLICETYLGMLFFGASSFTILDKKRRPLQWRKASGENTVLSSVNADSSLTSISPAAGTQARDSKQGNAKLRLIEQVNILQDDTEGKCSTVSARKKIHLIAHD